MSDQSEQEVPENDNDGIWIGIDLGTSNSACAVWDSSRGGSKWVRLRGITESTGTKIGRIMPSVVRFQSAKEAPVVGFPALKTSSETSTTNSSLVRSVKRLLGKRFEDLDEDWVETLDFDVRDPNDDEEDESLQLTLRTNTTNQTVKVMPQQILAMELKAIREACQAYLNRYRISKNLQVPGGDETPKSESQTPPAVNNVVVGVPAHYSQRHIGLVKEACRAAGFQGYIGTCLESTAAAIAYGLTLQERSKRSTSVQKSAPVTIMVVDMGGGTTDITIASNRTTAESSSTTSDDSENDIDPSSSYRVLVTQGDDNLGGDDIDQAIMEYCLNQVSKESKIQNNHERREARSDSLKIACRKAKESLCRLEDPSPSETIMVKHDGGGSDSVDETHSKEIEISQQILNETILTPWLERARDLILKARNNLNRSATTSDLSIDEVILVGGTTRVPAIRRMIQDIFPEIELSSSLNPMSSVAQGLAVQAAIVSKKIPMHQLKSAMMLDCVPHAIGVQLPFGGFVEIIPRNTLLPAMGSATFVLADKHQAGLTISAVEEVGEDKYEPMSKEDFSFVLRRLTEPQSETMTARTIEVGMKLDTDGRFIVSVFDENDPEQVRKRDHFERMKKGEVVGELDYIKDMMMAESNDITKEQLTLVIMLVTVFVLYVSIKIAFTDPLENGSTILG
eukprot:CAMPEP_0116143870 /NCGR_PEP_ID=MMETSP0329-20121206/15680_1 /TAXON_ID=697910 /ORGANISM="Pseudo-nitzschia arenysensis, Strain B593" /LENGTH=679 /DNA_ID=CAMNT_0003639217 /DNA_START=41 /DNA_END=2080 /DNA_ORIENTATION=+